MTQSLTVYEDIRKHIGFVEEVHYAETNEALGDLVSKAKTWWSGRTQRAGSRELDYFTNEHAKWLGVIMGREGVDYPSLTFDHMRNYLSANNISLTPEEITPIFKKISQQYGFDDIQDQTTLSSNKSKSQEIAKSIIRQGIMKAVSKQGLGKQSGTKQQAQSTTTAATAAQPATASPAAVTPNTTPQSKATTRFDPKSPPTFQVNIQGKTTNVWKTDDPRAPAGWVYYRDSWVAPPQGSNYAEWFDDIWTTNKMTEAVSTKSEINDRLDHLGAARQAEKQGDKALQYEKLADYHKKFSKVSKLKPADRIHHTTQAGIYRNAAQAVRSAQETLAKSSK